MKIERLKVLESGEYGIEVDGELFGVISAHPVAEFIVFDDGKYGVTLKQGSYEYAYKGKKLKIEVKDIPVEASPRGELGSKATRDDRADLAEHNQKYMELVLGRVVITEIGS